MAKKVPVSSLIGSDGRLETYPDPYKNVSPEMVATAKEIEANVGSQKSTYEISFLKLSLALLQIDNGDLYLARGYPDLKSYVQSPEIDLSWRVAQDLLKIQNKLVPLVIGLAGDEPVDVDQLIFATVISKTRALLPLLKDFPRELYDLLHRAPDMTYRDVVEEVKAIRAQDKDEDGKIEFRGQVKQGDTYSRLEVFAVDGENLVSIGTLSLRNEWLPEKKVSISLAAER